MYLACQEDSNLRVGQVDTDVTYCLIGGRGNSTVIYVEQRHNIHNLTLYGPLSISVKEATEFCKNEGGSLLDIFKLSHILDLQFKMSLHTFVVIFWMFSYTKDEFFYIFLDHMIRNNCEKIQEFESLRYVLYMLSIRLLSH